MKNKIVSFQILRAIAITLIFLSHCDYLLRIEDSNRLMYFGAAGVSLFIALSGFLTARKYDGYKEKVSALDQFKNRWKQFYKNHFITLIISIPLTLSALKSYPLQWGMKLVANAVLVQTLIPIESVYFSFNAVSWYLSLMLFFALMTPIAIKVWNKLSLKRL